MFDSLLVKPLIALVALLALTSSILFYLYRTTHLQLNALKTQYTQLEDGFKEQGKTIDRLNLNRDSEESTEVGYVNKVVGSCSQEKTIVDKIQSLSKTQISENKSNVQKTDVVDIDGKLPPDLARMLYTTNHPKDD
jgi:hypothetical protein